MIELHVVEVRVVVCCVVSMAAAFTIELRDKGHHGFLLGKEQVINGPYLKHALKQ